MTSGSAIIMARKWISSTVTWRSIRRGVSTIEFISFQRPAVDGLGKSVEQLRSFLLCRERLRRRFPILSKAQLLHQGWLKFYFALVGTFRQFQGSTRKG